VVEVTPHPKPGSRKPSERTRSFRQVATLAQWRRIRAEKFDGLACRLCDSPASAAGLHHILPRSLGGDDTGANVVRLCGSGTTGCHGLVESRDQAALSGLASSLTDAEYAYIVGKLGEGANERLFGVER
jgi:5-methylcytosine-specific restriction endonuclease McrA